MSSMTSTRRLYFGAAFAAGVASLVTYYYYTRSTKRRTAFNETEGSARVVVVTCDELLSAGAGKSATYAEEGNDEFLLFEALRARGITFHVRSWSDKRTVWSNYDVVLIRTPWDYSASEAQCWNYIRSCLAPAARGNPSRVRNNARVQVWNCHKGYLSDIAASAAGRAPAAAFEIATIPSVLVMAGERGDLAAILQHNGWGGNNGGLMIKPAVGGGSRACFAVPDVSAAGAIEAAQAFLDAHSLGSGAESESLALERSAAATLMASVAPHQSASLSSTRRAAPISANIASAATHAAFVGARDARASAWSKLAARCSQDAACLSQAAKATPCDMLVQPFLPTVADGELSVIVIGGRVTHAVKKVPVKGSWKCQGEFGAVATCVPVSPLVADLALRVVATAIKCAEESVKTLDAPSSPGAAEAAASAPAAPLSVDDVAVARVDFLALNPVLHDKCFGAAAARGEHTPDATRTPLLVLEAELIEPALFFKEAAEAGIDSAGALADLVQQWLS
jgi:hypothetical protein